MGACLSYLKPRPAEEGGGKDEALEKKSSAAPIALQPTKSAMMIAKTTNKNTAAAESNHDDDSSPAAANWEKLLETGVIKRKSVTFKIDKDFATTAEDESKEVAVDNDEEVVVLDKEKLAAISSYLDNVFDFDEFIKAKEKFDSSNTLSNNDNDAGSGKQASMSSLRSSLSGRSVVLDMEAEGDIANMLLGKRARHALEMMDVFIKEVMEETCQKTIGGGADEPIPLEMSRIVLDLNR